MTRGGGLIVPVLENAVFARRWAEGTYNIDSLLTYPAVRGTALDTVPLPGATSEAQTARILGHVASLVCRLKKAPSARLLAVTGKKARERTDFNNPFLVNATP